MRPRNYANLDFKIKQKRHRRILFRLETYPVGIIRGQCALVAPTRPKPVYLINKSCSLSYFSMSNYPRSQLFQSHRLNVSRPLVTRIRISRGTGD